jgi:hypothetical protein
LAIMGEWAQNDLVGLLTPALILGVPLFDIAFVGVVRIVTGPVLEALGFTRTKSVCVVLSISTTLGLSAMLLENTAPRQAVLVLLQATCALLLIAVLEGVGRGRGR